MSRIYATLSLNDLRVYQSMCASDVQILYWGSILYPNFKPVMQYYCIHANAL